MTTTYIADPKDDRLADFRALNDQSLRRKLESDEFFIAEGYIAIERLIKSGHVVRSVLLAPSRVSRFEPHLQSFAEADVPVYVAQRETIAEVVGFDMHRGVIASANRKPSPSLGELISTSLRIAVLEGLNDAENLGAISRAARAFGIDGLMIDPTCTDPYSRRTVRVSMGEVLFLPIVRISEPNWLGALHTLEAAGFKTWAMTPEPAAVDLWRIPVPERLAVLLGAEGPGLSEQSLVACSRRVRIPIRPEVDSLNVGHAAAVTFAAIGRPMIIAPPRPHPPRNLAEFER